MTENRNQQEPLSDLAYDWVTIIQHKSEALRAYEKYMQDAQQANAPQCVELMRQIYEQDANHVQQATRHLMDVLKDSRMGAGGRMQASQGQVSQGESARPTQSSQSSARSGGVSSSGISQSEMGQSSQSSVRQGGGSSSSTGQGEIGGQSQSRQEEREMGRGQQRNPRSG